MKSKLELNWVGKNSQIKLEPRILLEDVSKSYFFKNDSKPNGHLENMIVFGDNLLGLKALEKEYLGKIKCIVIDPPYNTGSAFSQYDDGVEHSIWLSLIRDRLIILRSLLSSDGSIWITIDDNESHYLKVLCDEIFGRSNFVANAVWQKKYTISNDAKWLSDNHDHILIFAKEKERWRPNPLPRTAEMDARYKNPDNHPKGVWKATPLHAKSGSANNKDFSFIFKNGVTWRPPSGTYPRFSASTLKQLDEENAIWFGKDGDAIPSRKTFLSDISSEGTPCPTIWLQEDVGNNHEAREEVKSINSDDPFSTPKPERLIRRILELSTNPGDLVLDSFAGSGTTGAVAHKMGRSWIMIELGEHCHTHIIPRLKKVIDGQDPGGITEAVGWKGGGGFRYYRLAPSLLEKDAWENLVISKEYNPAMLAEAMCRHMGFSYEPSAERYWMHGKSSETDFIYVTTASLTFLQLRALSEEVGESRTLLICCKAFTGNADEYPNLTIKKIPSAVLRKCEWGRDDYSLNVSNLPESDDSREENTEASVAEPAAPFPKSPAKRGRPSKVAAGGPNLFDADSAA